MRVIQPRLNYYLSIKEIFIALGGYLLLSKNKLRSNDYQNKNTFYFDNARSGLQLILELLPVGSNVGVQPLTCHTVLEAIENANCKAVFIDINKQLVIDNDALRSHINEIDALILTHTFGFMANVNDIKLILKDKLLIEDCAHAFLSENTGTIAGNTGDASIFSFGFAKFPSAIRGGYLKLNNNKYLLDFKKTYENVPEPTVKMKLINLINSVLLPLLNNQLIYAILTSKIKNKKKDSYTYSKPTEKRSIYSSFISNKAIFENQLKSIDEKLECQQLNGADILSALMENEKFVICQNSKEQNYFMIPVLTRNPDDFIEFAKKKGIEIGRHFYSSKSFIEQFGYKKESCPNYENIIEQLLTMPSHYNYPKKQKQTLIELITNY